jgi:hypothetical protein
VPEPGTFRTLPPANTRTPAGHPEGYIEAFANIYGICQAVTRFRQNGELKPLDEYDFPDVADGVRGMAFVSNMINQANPKPNG